MKTYRMKIGDEETYVVEIRAGIPLPFDTQEKAEKFIIDTQRESDLQFKRIFYPDEEINKEINND